MFPGIKTELEDLINGWLPIWREEAFITCFSEHDDDEDDHGRLSMWRAYGAPTGVAMVMNPDVFHSSTDALAAYTSPVAYLSKEDFLVEFQRKTTLINQNSEWLVDRGRQRFLNYLFSMFKYALLCTKHPGFSEEREWRVIYVPKEEKSTRIVDTIKTITGFPQSVCEIPLEDVPEENLIGASIPKLLDRLIVGPSEYAHEISSTLIKLLDAAGVENASERVRVSGIPLRTT